MRVFIVYVNSSGGAHGLLQRVAINNKQAPIGVA